MDRGRVNCTEDARSARIQKSTPSEQLTIIRSRSERLLEVVVEDGGRNDTSHDSLVVSEEEETHGGLSKKNTVRLCCTRPPALEEQYSRSW